MQGSELWLGPQLVGGRNNEVYEVCGSEQQLCIKFFRDDRRDGFHREVTLLRVLAATMTSKVPVVLAADEDSTSVLMSKIPGIPVTDGNISRKLAVGILATLTQLYAVDPGSMHLPDVAWPPLRMLARTSSMIGEALGEQARADWESSSDRLRVPALLGAENRRSCVGRGDPALDNILWDQEVAHLVDFESGGRSDVVHEVAEFLEHPQHRLLDSRFKCELVERLLRPEDLLGLAASRWLLRSFWSVRTVGIDRQASLNGLIRVESLSEIGSLPVEPLMEGSSRRPSS
ncbi:aminoglycoside phosphotransferase family protein [Leifsonia kafniensis]